jgi:hypothetical protein
VIYFGLLYASFFIALSGAEVLGSVFGIMIYGFVPMGSLALIAAAWGNKLTELKEAEQVAASNGDKPSN